MRIYHSIFCISVTRWGYIMAFISDGNEMINIIWYYFLKKLIDLYDQELATKILVQERLSRQCC
jgi:hypothetical protein